MKYTIDLDYEMVDKIIFESLKSTHESFVYDLEQIKQGKSVNVFHWGDDEADVAEIQKHIDALELLIEWYRIPE